LWPLEHNIRQGKTKRLIGLFKNSTSFFVLLIYILPHANSLGSLTWEYKCNFTQYILLLYYHFRTVEPQVSPPPKPTRQRVSPSFTRPCSTASASATGIEAADIFPYLSILMSASSSVSSK